MEDDYISRLADHCGVNEEEISRMQTRVSGRDLSSRKVPPERTRPLTGICCFRFFVQLGGQKRSRFDNSVGHS